jgi:hypothetical protein
MRRYSTRRKNPPSKQMGTGNAGFSGALQTLSHPSAIKPNELVEARNVRYKANGVLHKREGYQAIGSPTGERVVSLKAIYNIDGNDYLIRISDTGVAEYYNFTNSVWTILPGSPTFSNVYTNIIQAYGNVYFLNPVDPMRKWDGTSWSIWTPLADPTTPPTLAKTGSGDDNIRQYYRYVWYNNTGNTFASTAAYIDDLPFTLDASTYVTVTLPAAPVDTVWTAIFRGTIAGEEVYLEKIPANQTVYLDKGYIAPDDTLSVPRANTTAGFHFKFADVYRNTLIGVTTELGDDTLVGSGGGDKIDSFGRSDGGFYYDWNRDSGDIISGVKTFTLSNEDGLYVFKRSRIGVFQFDSAGGAVRDINVGMGAVSHTSIHPAGNDLRAWGDEGAVSVRNEPNFANIIRTKILSIKADSIVKSVTQTEIENVSGHFFDNLTFYGLPTGADGTGNTTCLVYDDEFAGWSEWRGMRPQVFTTFIRTKDNGGDNKPTLYFGDSASGNVMKMFSGKTDNGDPVVFRITTKQFDDDRPYAYKKYKKIIYIFGNVTGSGTVLRILEDGVRSQLPAIVQAVTGHTGFGQDRWHQQRWGESSGTYEADTSGLIIKYADLFNKDLFSIQTTIENSGLLDDLSIIGVYIIFTDSARPLPSSAKLRRAVAYI